ncbi:MAG: hypothetical protein PVF81_06560 [Thioalkalispiraceae bacterium]
MRTKTRHISGISMIELVIFILVIAIAFVGVMTVFINTQRYSADPMIRIKTVELAQSLMEEIMLRAYDENTPVGGGCVDNMASTRCGPAANIPNANAPTSASFGPEGGETRALFDDVDDYHNIAYCGNGGTADAACTAACTALLDEQGNNIAADYPGFGVCIRVSFAGNEINAGGGLAVLNNDAKRIDIIITDPRDSELTFSAYRTNF